MDPLGDVDVELVDGWRMTDQKARRACTAASGKKFNTYVDEMMWPQTEFVQHLRNRSAALNITLEDIDLITDASRILYSIDDAPDAAPPPADRQPIGL